MQVRHLGALNVDSVLRWAKQEHLVCQQHGAEQCAGGFSARSGNTPIPFLRGWVPLSKRMPFYISTSRFFFASWKIRFPALQRIHVIGESAGGWAVFAWTRQARPSQPALPHRFEDWGLGFRVREAFAWAVSGNTHRSPDAKRGPNPMQHADKGQDLILDAWGSPLPHCMTHMNLYPPWVFLFCLYKTQGGY